MTDETFQPIDLNDLLRAVSHEMRDPLTAILFITELILLGTQGEVNERVQENMYQIREIVEQTLPLVERIMDLLSFEVQFPERCTHDLAPILELACEDVQSAAEAANSTIWPDIPKHLPFVWINADAVRRIVKSMLTIECLLDVEEVALVAAVIDDAVVVSVQDGSVNGIEDAICIDSVLAMLPNTQIALELLLCQRIIQHLGGQFWACGSSEGFNISLHFSLPVSDDRRTNDERH